VQDFPARYAPQMGWEGTNVIFDTWVQPLMMGLEEHLLQMFRGDFEFHEDAAPSHLGAAAQRMAPAPEMVAVAPAEVAAPAAAGDAVAAGAIAPAAAPPAAVQAAANAATWAPEAERELQKIPFFVRGKARRNTELYAASRSVALITVETLYEAKAHYKR
jgi:light-independent protochlorophyllide reductase subunit B